MASGTGGMEPEIPGGSALTSGQFGSRCPNDSDFHYRIFALLWLMMSRFS
jgi:hypothetical protein